MQKTRSDISKKIKDLKRRTSLSACYFMWKPDQGGFVAYGDRLCTGRDRMRSFKLAHGKT